MAQHIAVVKVDEKGSLIEKLDVNFADVMNALQEFTNSTAEFPWIATIDPYDSIIFNSLQIPLVVKELIKLKESLRADDLRAKVAILIDDFGRLDAHEYIKFVGD
jgi:hypothetical protein